MRTRQAFVWFVAVSALSFGTVAFAQNPPKPPAKAPARASRPAITAARSDPFIGVWRLNADKSKNESGGVPKGLIRTYEDRGNGTIVMTTDAATAQGTTRSYLVYRRDGKPYPEAAIGADAIRLVTVKAIDRRTEELTFFLDGKPVESGTTITFSVSADGKTMTQVLTGKTSQGRTFTNTLVFDRQPGSN